MWRPIHARIRPRVRTSSPPQGSPAVTRRMRQRSTGANQCLKLLALAVTLHGARKWQEDAAHGFGSWSIAFQTSSSTRNAETATGQPA